MIDQTMYFCSGYGDLTEEEFQKHYVPQIDEAFKTAEGKYCGRGFPLACKFIMGDYHGADFMCLKYINEKESQGIAKEVAVFMSPKGETSNEVLDYIKSWHICTFENFRSIKERDAMMTCLSVKDIQWERDPSQIKNYDPNFMTKTKLNRVRRETLTSFSVWSYMGLADLL